MAETYATNAYERGGLIEGAPAAQLDVLVQSLFERYGTYVEYQEEHREAAQARYLFLSEVDPAGQETKLIVVTQSDDALTGHTMKNIIIQEFEGGTKRRTRRRDYISAVLDGQMENDVLLIECADVTKYYDKKSRYQHQAATEDRDSEAQKQLRHEYETLQTRQLIDTATIAALQREIATATLQPRQ